MKLTPVCFDMGFIPSVELILKYIAQRTTNHDVSATTSDTIIQIADKHMKIHLQIEIQRINNRHNHYATNVYCQSIA